MAARGNGQHPTPAEMNELVALQQHIASTPEMTRQRNRMLVILNKRGVTQRSLAELLSSAADDVGADRISEDGVQKAIRDYVDRYGAPSVVAR